MHTRRNKVVGALAALFVVVASTLLLARPAAAEPKRPPQRYGGPEEGKTSALEVVEWVPRVALFPLWVLSEFAVRRPLGAFLKFVEDKEVVMGLMDILTFGERRQISIIPSAMFDFGLLPSVGFNASWRHFLAETNTASLHFGTWGPDWISIRATDEYELAKGRTLSFDTSIVRRQDNPFFGMGPRSSADGRVRYQSTGLEMAVGYQHDFWRSSSFQARAGARSLTFGEGTCCGQPALRDAVAAGGAPPPGFDEGYGAGFQRLAIAVDSRQERPRDGGGLRFEAHEEAVFAPSTMGPRAWIKYGGSAGAAVDVTGYQRVLSLTVYAELADPITGVVPFTDQVSLGGNTLMRGYLSNRLVDRSALVASLRYTWPVWVYLDGVIETDVGNVFGARFSELDPRLLRLTSAIGVRSNGARGSGFEILVAAGTDPFENGFAVSSARLVLGSHHGF